MVWPLFLPWMFVGFFSCLALNMLCVLVLNETPWYLASPYSLQLDTAVRFVSTVHAAFCSVVAVVQFNDPLISTDLVHGWNTLASTGCGITAGYMLYDSFATYRVVDAATAAKEEKLPYGFSIFVHHAVVLAASVAAGYVQIAGFFCACLMLTETSTVFLNLRWFMSRMRDTLAYRLNYVALIVAYFVCRVSIFPYILYRYAQVKGIPVQDSLFALPLQCAISSVFFFVMFVVWFGLLLVKLPRELSLSKHGQGQSVKQEKQE